jgi:hypothetical protein
LAKGSDEEALILFADRLRRMSGVHEVNSLLDGATESRS